MQSFQPARGQLRLLQRYAVRFNSNASAAAPAATTAKSDLHDENTIDVNIGTNTTIETESVQVTESHRLLNAHNQPYDGPLEEISEMSEVEFNEELSKWPSATSGREEVLQSRFEKLLSLYGNKDKLRKQFSSSSSLLAKFPNLLPSDKLSPYTEAELAIRQKHHQQVMGDLGSKIINVYKPHELITNPPSVNQVTVEKLLAAGAHLGRSTTLYNHHFQPFIYGKYKGLHIIDLEQTASYLKHASKVIEKVVENGGIVLFLGLKIGQLRSIKVAATRCNGYYVAKKWIPGAITNSLENPKPRHEVDMQDFKTNRELTTDQENQVVKPDLIVILNPENASVAIKEANQARIPTIGIVDTNVDPNLVTYPIPANSNSTRVTNLITGVLGKSAEAGLKRRIQKVAEYKKTLGMEPTEAFVQVERAVIE